MSDGRFKLARIWLGRLYLMGLRYIQSRRNAIALEPNEGRTNPVGRIYPTRTVATVLEPDEDIRSGRIYPPR
jgi:hypothetical protein